MTNYQIGFFDIDGTLVDNRTHSESFLDGISESTRLAIKKLKQAGILPVIATGRGKSAILDLAEELGIDSFITSNGQEITYKGEQIYQRTIDSDIIDRLFVEFENRKVDVLYETINGVFTVSNQELGNKIPVQVLEPETVPKDVFQLIVRTDHHSGLHEWLTELKIVKVAPIVANVLPFGVSKASGIHVLLEKLKIPVEASLGFGDEENDLEMFRTVGTAVAMGNASEELKSIADFITKEVWNDGIYHACETLALF